MNWLQALILGLVQGLTEFLPVSSSGHLAIGREILGVEASEDLVFEITVHAATVLATIIVFRKQIWKLLCGLFKFKYNEETDYVLKILVSLIPVFVVGMLFKDVVEEMFSSLLVVGIALIVTALLLFFSDMVSKGRSAAAQEPDKYQNGISYWQAFVIGLGDGENFIASDIPAIIARTRRTYILNDGEFAVVRKDSIRITGRDGAPVEKQVLEVNWNADAAEKGGYEHFMLKEIHEQPKAVRDTMSAHLALI